MKGCTAAYDLAAEFPLPSVDGLSAMAKAYEDVGMRAVLAPMVADLSFFEAIPGLMDRLPPALQKEVESFTPAPWKATTQADAEGAAEVAASRRCRLAVAPTIPHHCSDDFLIACRDLAKEYDVGIHSHVAESKVQVVAGYQTLRHVARRPHGRAGPGRTERFTVAHGVWLDDDDMKRLGDRGASVAHNPGSNMRLGSGLADVRGMLDAQGQRRHRHRRRQLLGQPEHVRGDAAGLARLQGPGAGLAALARHRGGAYAPRPKAAPARSAWPSRSAGSRRATRPTSSSSTCTTSTGSRSTIR